MKHLLVIGAGKNQLPIIEAAKKLGCYVYVVTVAGDYPGISVADEWIEKSIFDKDEIVDLFRDGKRPIDGVVSDQSDMAAPIVAYVAERLGLPTWGYQNACVFSDKALMREMMEKIGLPVPEYQKVDSSEEARVAAKDIGYPVVVKPTNSFSSRGIKRVDRESNIEEAYRLAYDSSRTHEVVVERYIAGRQYFSQGFISNFKLNMFAFSDRYYYDIPEVFIPYTNAFPAKIDKDLEIRMVSQFQRILDYCKPQFGHVWAEWILDDATDELYIVEIAIRGGGAHVTTDLIPHAYGVDTQPYLVREALGEDTRFYDCHSFEQKAAAFYSFLLPEGEIVSVDGLDRILQIPGVMCADLKKMELGDRVPPIKDKGSRYGLIVVFGETRTDLENVWKRLRETVRIRVKTENGIRNAIWE